MPTLQDAINAVKHFSKLDGYAYRVTMTEARVLVDEVERLSQLVAQQKEKIEELCEELHNS